MRRTAFGPFVLASLLIPGAIQAQTKIGFVNMQEILAAAPGAKEAQTQFNKELQGYQAQVQQLQDTLQNMQDQLQQQQLTLSPEAKKNREQEIQQKQQEYQQRYQDLQNEANQRKQALMEPILNKVDSIIEQIRKEAHYALIFDASAGSIIAADTTLDLTQEVIRRLKAEPAVDSAKAGAKKGTGGSSGTR